MLLARLAGGFWLLAAVGGFATDRQKWSTINIVVIHVKTVRAYFLGCNANQWWMLEIFGFWTGFSKIVNDPQHLTEMIGWICVLSCGFLFIWRNDSVLNRHTINWCWFCGGATMGIVICHNNKQSLHTNRKEWVNDALLSRVVSHRISAQNEFNQR